MVLYAMPEFWLGMLLLVFLGARTGWFPTGGVRDLTQHLTGVRRRSSTARRHLFLPVLTLVLAYLGSYSLIMRSSIIETVREDYLTVARAKGLRDDEVMRRHAVPNAMLPSVSLIAIGFGFVVGGAITTETVFSYPGLGPGDLGRHQERRPGHAAGAVLPVERRAHRGQPGRRPAVRLPRPPHPAGAPVSERSERACPSGREPRSR